MEHAFAFHRHTRSMSSLASTIIPLNSDASAFTSVTASPMDSQDLPDLPSEVKEPLPISEPSSRKSLELGDNWHNGNPSIQDQKVPDSDPATESLQEDKTTVSAKTSLVVDEPPLNETQEQEPEMLPSDRASPPSEKTTSMISFKDLRDLIGQERYHHTHVSSLRARLENLRWASGFNRRLIPSSSVAYQSLFDHFRLQNLPGFAELYQTCEALSTTPHGHKSSGISMADRHSLFQDLVERESVPWVSWIPNYYREIIIDFITKLRTDTNFLADRLSNLSSLEFARFLQISQSQSVFEYPFPSNAQHRPSGHHRSARSTGQDTVLDQVRCFHQGDPQFLLLHGIFDSSSGANSKDYFLRTEIWSSACAQIISEGKRGSDELTMLCLDAFADHCPWPLMPRIETYIARTLQGGAFLTDTAYSQKLGYNEPLEIRNANAVIASSEFFDRALKEFLQLLLDTPPHQILPNGTLRFVRVLLGKIASSDVRKRAKTFIASKWFFSSFLSRLIVHPEKHGIMMTNHIGANARKNILNELANRMQKQVLDTILPWKHTVQVDPAMKKLVEDLVDIFDADHSSDSRNLLSQPESTYCIGQFFQLSMHDVIALIHTLFPGSIPSAPSFRSSTAESSTLISESLGYDKREEPTPAISSGRSTNSSLFTDVGPSGSGSSRPGDSPQNESQVGLISFEKNRGETLGDLGDRLNSVAEYLVERFQLSLETPTKSSDVNWALFEIDQKGKVFVSDLDSVHVFAGEDIHQNDFRSSDNAQELKSTFIDLIGNQALARNVPEHMNHHLGHLYQQDEDPKAYLESLLDAAIEESQSQYDYQSLFHLWELRRGFQEISASGSHIDMLRQLADDLRASVDKNIDITRKLEQSVHSLSTVLASQAVLLRDKEEQRRSLRLKMWYVSEVRHSATYEDAVHVTQALRAMSNPPRSKQPASVANWARQRLRTSSLYERSVAQSLEALTAPDDQGGFSKLGDEQVERTTRWLTQNSIENFCRGEERIHRFCYEIQRCVKKLTGPSLLDSPVLWSSRLFEHEKRTFEGASLTPRRQALGQPSMLPSQSLINKYDWGIDQNVFDIPGDFRTSFFTERELSVAAALQPNTFHNDPSPREPMRPWPQNSSTPIARSSAMASTYTGSSNGHMAGGIDLAKRKFGDHLKDDIYSLFLSDLGYPLWNAGSETDGWVSNGLDNTALSALMPVHTNSDILVPTENSDIGSNATREKTAKIRTCLLMMSAPAVYQARASTWKIRIEAPANDVNTENYNLAVSEPNAGSDSLFPYKDMFKQLLERFSLSHSPHRKLCMLRELEHLVSRSIQQALSSSSEGGSRLARPKAHTSRINSIGSRGPIVPRTKATSFEEVIANCTERRASTLNFNSDHKFFLRKSLGFPSEDLFSGNKRLGSPDLDAFGTEDIVNSLLDIFRDVAIRPQTLFRDLQYIAAFVPASILDQTAEGKAFWDCGLAALALKEDLCTAMIDRATQITSYCISDTKLSSSQLSKDFTHASLKDAGDLWIIAAKEGSATAARELGLLYLTHPELLPRVTLPFSKPKEVYKMVGGRKEMAAGSRDEARLDPLTFATVFHWMEVAANGGDKDARDFLRGNGDMNVRR